MIKLILGIIIIYAIIFEYVRRKHKVQKFYYREIPTNDSPAYVGKIIKGHADGNDFIATLLDLTYRGFINIQQEKIRGINKRVLYLQKRGNSLNLKEHELFIINQVFKQSDRIVFDDYVKSKNFRRDFKIFDKMLSKRIEVKKSNNNSMLKNINKIFLFTAFLIFGLMIFYSIILPMVLFFTKSMNLSMDLKIKITILISASIFVFSAYKLISYINKTHNAKENINLNIIYIILCIVVILLIGFISKIKIIEMFMVETLWYEILLNCIISLITLLYIFNIIRDKEKYLYYIFIGIGLIAVFINFRITMCICIVFIATYLFYKSPKYVKIETDDFIYKWTGFKNYLNDYSILATHEENAMLIWEKYLIYAVSLGVNKKIIKKYGNIENSLLSDTYLKKLYTEYFE